MDSQQAPQNEIGQRPQDHRTENVGSDKYKNALKIAALLRESKLDEQEVIKVLEKGLTDICIPVPRSLIDDYLGPAQSGRFRNAQARSLTSTFEIGNVGSPTAHANLRDEAVDSTFSIPISLEKLDSVGANASKSFVTGVGVKGTSGASFALKRITRKVRDAREIEAQMKYLQGELDALKKIRHYHYVNILGSYTTSGHVGIFMSPLADKNLGQFLDEYKPTQAKLLAEFFGCLATGLYKLHYKYKIRHKDIKPENILIQGGHILLADFGIALDWAERDFTTTREETLRSPVYCAPEVGKDRERGSGSDIWSLGCVFLEMTTVLKGHPRSSVKDTLEYRGNGSTQYWRNVEGVRSQISTLEQSVNPGCGNEPLVWIKEMLKEERKDRCTAGQLINKIHSSRGKQRLSFCGMCCNDGIGADSDDEESGDIAKYQDIVDTKQPRRERVLIYDAHELTWHDATMNLYTESPTNWISPSLVKQCHLNVNDEHHESAIIFQGHKLKSTESVEATWELKDGGTRTEKLKFFIPKTDPPFEMLVAISSYNPS